MGVYIIMCTCMATIHLHQRGSDDASADPLVPYIDIMYIYTYIYLCPHLCVYMYGVYISFT